MNRWFFADETEDCTQQVQKRTTRVPTSSSDLSEVPEVAWPFCVLMHDTLVGNEKVAVVGDCEALGNWHHNKCAILVKEEDSNKWSGNILIPRDRHISFRYFICAIDPSTENIIVRRWETHLTPRTLMQAELEAMSVKQSQLQARVNASGEGEGEEEEDEDNRNCDVFGYQNTGRKVDRGWLTTETMVQFKVFNAPFTWKQRSKRRILHVKVTPMNLKIPGGCDNSTPLPLEDSLSNDTREACTDLSTAFAFNEVATLRADGSEIGPQPQFGTACGPDDLVIFHLTIGDFENTAYLIDLYTYSSKAADDEPPYHLGYHYVMPNLFKRSEGFLDVTIACATKHRPLGMMRFGYLIIQPTRSLTLDMTVSYLRYWNRKWTGLDVGHRGLGPSFKTTDSVIRENTIFSLKYAADHGADMVEFDVQLSKDLVPVVYHDFMIYVSLKSKNDTDGTEFLQLPMRDLTLEQLKTLKVYHTAEGQLRESRCFQFHDLQEHQPFPQLEEVLDAVNPHVGFNIEVKWSQKLQDGTMEEQYESVVDRNLYLDVILDVVFRKAGSRRIVFSCFDPDICTMLRFKQNRYPVMFLTQGETTKYKKYWDPRCGTMEKAVFNTLAMELLGIVAHTEDLLRDPTQVHLAKSRGLVLFCWGDDNNSKETIKFLKNLGLHAIIYDKMDKLTSKEIKQSVFLIQARESQNDMLKLQALESGKAWHHKKAIPHQHYKKC